MKFKYLGIGVILATMTLSACDININTGSGSDTKDAKDSNEQAENSNDNNNDDNQSSSNNNTSSDNNNQKRNSNNDKSIVTRGNVIDFVESYEGHSLDTDQYNYKEPEKDDNGSWGFSFTDNDGDLAGSYIVDKYGNVTKYDEDGEIDNSDDDDSTSVTRGNVIDFVESYEGHSLDTDQYTYKEPEKNDKGNWGFSFTDKDGNLAGSYIVDKYGSVTKYDEDGEIDYGSDDDDDSTSVTRGNVIDFVESYEGHSLDTDQYTYKEPEQSNNGDWGFSFTDKDGNLAGSYIVDEYGDVTKYDEDGDPE
ncbi:hypothetical protein [Mammaliicoccus vitulinus]|uniref:hypothetical protein n=1 Tax=Mammaliicoccus vitulinus TaxID=71237 RepID=UPI001ADEBFCF|nr:hypothetical protein [Mammaliicoccus vitulinus]QTN10936.1 hypothetical protein G7A42_03320 [Mammaliicoccus vitulinus]